MPEGKAEALGTKLPCENQKAGAQIKKRKKEKIETELAAISNHSIAGSHGLRESQTGKLGGPSSRFDYL